MAVSKNHVVVGGGIAGIVAAICLAQRGQRVILVETADKLGGLLTSKFIEGHYYDHGTHIPGQTGIEELDQILSKGLDVHWFDFIRNGTFHGELFPSNGFLSDRSLAPETQKKCLRELIDVNHQSEDKGWTNLEQQLIATFGAGYYQHLLKDVVRKLFFEDAANLSPDSHYLFGLNRIIVGDSKTTDELKKEPRLDNVIAYHSYTQGQKKLKNFYPKQGGAGAWINHLEAMLISLGVTIMKNAKFKLNSDGNTITELVVNDSTFPVERLYWTVPPVFLYNLLPIQRPAVSMPRRLTSVIVDLEYTGKYLTDVFYLQNYDPSYRSFRITLYDNFSTTSSSDKVCRISVEFLSNESEIEKGVYEALAKEELVKMSIAEKQDQLRAVNTSFIKDGFPIPTPKFKADSEALVNGLEPFANLVLFGKSTGKKWFMNEVIAEIYQQLKV